MGLRESLRKDPVSKLPLRQAVTVSRKTTVRQAMAQMRQMHLGCVIVVDRNKKPIGKFTERKVMRLLVEDPGQLDDPVDKFMYPTGDPVPLDMPIARMVEIMQSRQLRFLSVVDQAGKVVALTGQKGLMEYIVDFFPRQVKVQRLRPVLYMRDREGA